MSRLAIFLLAPPRIELDDEPIQISRRKVVALLAYLAVTGTLTAGMRWRRCSGRSGASPERVPTCAAPCPSSTGLLVRAF
jgi:hypothetical protein